MVSNYQAFVDIWCQSGRFNFCSFVCLFDVILKSHQSRFKLLSNREKKKVLDLNSGTF